MMFKKLVIWFMYGLLMSILPFGIDLFNQWVGNSLDIFSILHSKGQLTGATLAISIAGIGEILGSDNNKTIFQAVTVTMSIIIIVICASFIVYLSLEEQTDIIKNKQTVELASYWLFSGGTFIATINVFLSELP